MSLRLIPLLVIAAIVVVIRFVPTFAPEAIQGTNPDAEAFIAPPMPDSEIYRLVEGSIYDGDTLQVKRCGEQCEELKIRLCGIDAPEKEQPFGFDDCHAETGE